MNRIQIRIYSVWKFQPNTNTNIIRFLKCTELFGHLCLTIICNVSLYHNTFDSSFCLWYFEKIIRICPWRQINLPPSYFMKLFGRQICVSFSLLKHLMFCFFLNSCTSFNQGSERSCSHMMFLIFSYYLFAIPLSGHLICHSDISWYFQESYSRIFCEIFWHMWQISFPSACFQSYLLFSASCDIQICMICCTISSTILLYSPVPSFQNYQFQDASALFVIITPIKTYFVIMLSITSMTAEWL